MIYFSADTKTTPASVQGVGVDFEFHIDFASPHREIQGVGVDFEIDMDFASPQRSETFS
jgi:hypothetical protein